MSTFIKINYSEVRDVLNKKIQEEPIKQEGEIKYRNFVIMDLIQKIEPSSYVDFGFSKVLASYFDIPINQDVSKVTLEDFNKVNKTLSEIEKHLNREVKTKGALYLTRKDNAFCVMYYEVLS